MGDCSITIQTLQGRCLMYPSIYQDRWSRYHDKPCTKKDGSPSSNNGWIYTAYAVELGFGVDWYQLDQCMRNCKRSHYPQWDRTPGKALPPLSRDEILGMYSLSFIKCGTLKLNHWQFCNIPGFHPKPLTQLNWLKVIKALWKIRKEHRNTLWEEKDLWHVGFRLPPQDTWFILKLAEREVGLIHTMYFYISAFFTINGKSASGKLILWLKLKHLRMEGSILYQALDHRKAFLEYFGTSHPFNKQGNL